MNKNEAQTIGKEKLIQHLEHTTGFCMELRCQTICNVQQIVSISASILNHFGSQRTQSPIFTLGFQNQGRKKQNGSGYQAIAILEFLSFQQTYFEYQKKYGLQHVCTWLSFSKACHLFNTKHNAR